MSGRALEQINQFFSLTKNFFFILVSMYHNRCRVRSMGLAVLAMLKSSGGKNEQERAG